MSFTPRPEPSPDDTESSTNTTPKLDPSKKELKPIKVGDIFILNGVPFVIKAYKGRGQLLIKTLAKQKPYVRGEK